VILPMADVQVARREQPSVHGSQPAGNGSIATDGRAPSLVPVATASR
jgi:hypothetical protein